MSRSQSLLLLIAMSIDIVHSWDVAITSGNQMEFYSNQNKTGSEGAQFRDLTALAYDAVHSMLFFVDKQSDNASIFSYNLATKKYQSLVRKRPSDNIQGVAFDPVTGLLFWTDFTERSIFYISLMRDSKNDIYGNLSIKMDDELPRAIAVDSCRGYIYWTNTNNTKPTIERARFDGKERTVIVNTNIFMPVSLAIDQQTKRLYWADDKEGIHYSIESSDLDGKDRVTLLSGTDHYPNSMTVSKDSIFWVDWGFKKVWTIPKIPTNDIEPKEYIAFKNKPFGIVANYTIEDQFENASECRKLSSHFKENKTYINDTFSVPPDAGLFCVHGVKVIDKLECKCTAGYTGDRCDISVCKNYCFKGHCTFTAEGNPMCSCSEGVTGDRCEKEVCYNYCLNNGICKINEGNKPVCLCSRDFEGSRCENVKPIPTTSNSLPTTTRTTKETQSLPKTEDSRRGNEQFADKKCETELCYNYCLNNGTCTINEKQDAVCTCFRDFEGLRCENVKPIPSTTANRAVRTTKETQILSNPEVSCNCTKEETATKIASSDNSGNLNKDDIFEESSCNDGWDTFSHPAFIVLGITCGLLSVACVVLITKIMQLKKRPRIKKRIIVNKNVTPLTARPDQCEITIENCCNMNICETPCFEPRSTIRATLINSKPGKEEKRNLISNMECPEDY